MLAYRFVAMIRSPFLRSFFTAPLEPGRAVTVALEEPCVEEERFKAFVAMESARSL